MSAWWTAAGVWVALSVPVALFVGRMIRIADRLARRECQTCGRVCRDPETGGALPPERDPAESWPK
jgi:hypothetical protein